MGFTFSQPASDNPKIIVPSRKEHKKTLIWLHGVNAYAEEFLPIFNDPELSPVDDSTKVILLNAGLRQACVGFIKATVNSWFRV